MGFYTGKFMVEYLSIFCLPAADEGIRGRDADPDIAFGRHYERQAIVSGDVAHDGEVGAVDLQSQGVELRCGICGIRRGWQWSTCIARGQHKRSQLAPAGLQRTWHKSRGRWYPESWPDRRRVVFQKWRWPCLHRPPKGIAVDKQANDDVVHLDRFRKANSLANQAFHARS